MDLKQVYILFFPLIHRMSLPVLNFPFRKFLAGIDITAAEASNSGSTIKPNGTSEVAVGYATVIGTTGYVEIAQRK